MRSRAHYSADELFRSIDADEERQREALRKFYKRNSAPHYSKPIAKWKLAIAGLFLGGCLAALGVWWLITQALDRFQP